MEPSCAHKMASIGSGLRPRERKLPPRKLHSPIGSASRLATPCTPRSLPEILAASLLKMAAALGFSCGSFSFAFLPPEAYARKPASFVLSKSTNHPEAYTCEISCSVPHLRQQHSRRSCSAPCCS